MARKTTKKSSTKAKKTIKAKPSKIKSVKKTSVKKPAAKKVVKKVAPIKTKKTKKVIAKKTTTTVKKTSPKSDKKPSNIISTKKLITREKTKMSHKKPSLFDSLAPITPYQETFGEEYMNLEQRDHFRKLLLRWKHQLMEEVDRTVHHMQDEAANFPDPNDRATQEEEFSLELRARDRERKLIKKIDEALERLDKSDYGYCEACGVEIGVRRLEARPTATLCIDCKTIDEIREKSYG